MCRRRMRRAWSCIQPAWKAASWRLSAKMISFLWPSGAALIIAWARMWTSETVTAWTLRAGSIVRPADRERRRAARRAGRQAGPEGDQRQERLLVAAAVGQAAGRRLPVHRPALAAEPRPRASGSMRAVGPPSASSSSRLVRTSRVPVPRRRGGPDRRCPGPSSSWVALPFSKPRSWFFGPSGEFQVEVRTSRRSAGRSSGRSAPGRRRRRAGRRNRSLASWSDRNRCGFGSASVPSRATTISSRPRRKKWTLGRSSDSPPFWAAAPRIR